MIKMDTTKINYLVRLIFPDVALKNVAPKSLAVLLRSFVLKGLPESVSPLSSWEANFFRWGGSLLTMIYFRNKDYLKVVFTE